MKRNKIKKLFCLVMSVSILAGLPGIKIYAQEMGSPTEFTGDIARSEESIGTGLFIAPIEPADASATKIYTAEELSAIRDNLSGSYVLANDIDVSGYESWEPIGKSSTAPFRGKLDGQGHKITGLNVRVEINSASLNQPSHAVGLFGVCNGATVKNLELCDINISIKNSSGYSYDGCSINGTNIYAGGIAGYVVSQTVIYNCMLSGSVCSETSQEAMEAYAGGYIDHVSNHGSVTSNTEDFGNSYAGGLVGKAVSAQESLDISDGYNTGSVQAMAGNLFCDSSYAGGISGSFEGNVDRTYVSGTVNAKASSYVGGNAYAGGVCGVNGDASSIQNSAIVQPNVSAAGDGSSAVCRISNGNGNKRNNITISQVVSGSNNDADYVKSLDEMKTSVPYTDILQWDFKNTWELVDGNDFPQLKQIHIDDEDYREEYIEQHLEFIESEEYRNILSDYRWAQIYWSQENNFKSNMAGALYNGIDTGVKIISFKFGDLFDDQNPYKVILADYVADQRVANEIYELQKLEVPDSLDSIYKKTKKFIKDNWEDAWGKLDDLDIFYLFHYSDRTAEEWVRSGFPEHLEQIVSSTKETGEGLEKILNISTSTLDMLFSVKDKYNNIAEFMNELFLYSAHVEAYMKASSEFRTVLARMAENIPDSDADRKNMMAIVINSYVSYNDSDNIRLEMFKQFLTGKAVEGIKNIVAKTLAKDAEKWLKSVLSPAANNALTAIQWATDAGWKISEYIIKNGELQDCRNMLRANADIELVMFDTLRDIENEFLSNQTIENARLFDAAYRFFEETQIYSMDVCMAYLDTYQTAWVNAIRHLSTSTMKSAIEEVIYNKLYLYNTYCHGTSYNLGGKIIKIACPTDVYVYNESGDQVIAVVDNEVIQDTVGICAFTADDIKLIALPTDQEYQIKIVATDDGVMDYYVTEYDIQNDLANTIVYEGISLGMGKEYTGAISSELNAKPESYNLTSDIQEEITPSYQVNADNYIGISEIEVNELEPIFVGDSCKVQAVIVPENASFQSLVWYSSDTSIASVSSDGIVKGLAEGEAMITVYACL